MKRENKALIILFIIMGFIVGNILGFIFFETYINDVTNKYRDGYKLCAEKYNHLIRLNAQEPKLLQPLYNISIDIG